MSAGICLMNYHGVAMAADSAVTFEKGTARYAAKKLFKLCKNEPIGIIVYSNSTLMGFPMETIIGGFYNNSSDSDYQTVTACIDSFLGYLSENSTGFGFPEREKDYILFACQEFYRILKQQLAACVDQSGKNSVEAILNAAHEMESNLNISDDVISQYVSEKYSDTIHGYIARHQMTAGFDAENRYEIFRVICNMFGSNILIENYVGFAIAGYGRKDIVPHVSNIQINAVYNSRIWFRMRTDDQISSSKPYSITSYAQTDVIDTFLYGIDIQNCAKIKERLYKAFDERFVTMDTVNKEQLYSDAKSIFIDNVNAIIEDVREEHAIPILKGFLTLRPAELALMAEKMIDITSLKRLLVINELFGSVGGPTDVCIITKAGFEWIKHK